MWVGAVVLIMVTMCAITLWHSRRTMEKIEARLEKGMPSAPAPQPPRQPVPRPGNPYALAKRRQHEEIVQPPKTEGCDLCGYSSVEGSRHSMISPARHEVKTGAGSLFFCTHHFRAIAPLVVDKDYDTAGA